MAEEQQCRHSSVAGKTMFSMVVGTLFVVAVCVIVYELINLRDSFLVQLRNHQLRKEFVSLAPQLEKFHFVGETIRESQKIVDKGVYLSSFSKWWEDTMVYKLVTLESLYLKITFSITFVLVCLTTVVVGGYLLYHYYSNRYWMNQAMKIKQQEHQQHCHSRHDDDTSTKKPLKTIE